MTKPVLRFHEDGKFRVLMISDFHALPKQGDINPKLIAGINALMEETAPDLVVVGGDQCLNRDTFDEVKHFMGRVMEPVIRRNIPWCAVFGNHDREMGLDLEEEMKVYESLPGYVGEAGPEDISGVGNFVVPILSSKGDDVAYHVWGLDSLAEQQRELISICGLPKGTQFILPDSFGTKCGNTSPMFDQVMWYYQESLRREKEAGHKIPALMCLHIPPIEMCLVARNPEECDAYGSKREQVGCSEMNSGLFMACLQRGDVKGIFFGHDHYNDFHGTYCGITMGYDCAVGYDMSGHDDLRGGRVIDLTEDGGMTTRMVHLLDIMGKEAIKHDDFFEGHCNYFFRIR